MAGRITVSSEHLEDIARDLDALQDIVSEVGDMLAGVNTSRECGGEVKVQTAGSQIRGGTVAEATKSLRTAMRENGERIGKVSAAVRKSEQLFEKAEKETLGLAKAIGNSAPSPVYGDGKSGGGSGNSNSNGGNGTKGPWKTSGDWLGYEAEKDGLGGTAWLGKASAEYEDGDLYAGVNGYLGKAKTELKFESGLFKDKYKYDKYKDGTVEQGEKESFVLFEGAASVSGSLIAADGKVKTGNDMFGTELKAEGGLGNGTLEGKANISIGKSEKDGKETYNVNAVASGKAMVSAAEGKVSGTFNFLGFEIKSSIGGYAGAAGVEGKIGIENGKFVMEGGAAAVLGFSAGIEIGFNDTGLKNFVDFFTFWN